MEKNTLPICRMCKKPITKASEKPEYCQACFKITFAPNPWGTSKMPTEIKKKLFL